MCQTSVVFSSGETALGLPLGKALRVQEVLRKDPLSGHLFVFRGRRNQVAFVVYVHCSALRRADTII